MWDGAGTIVVVGSSNVDLVAEVARLPRPGETVTGATFRQALGGKGANQAVAAARAMRAGRVGFVACVGQDGYGDEMLTAFAAEGIDAAHVTRTADAATGTALILVGGDGENSIAVAAGANGLLTPADVDAASGMIGGARMVVLQMETPAETVGAALRVASAAGVATLLNYAPVGDAAVPLSDAVGLLVVNETEAAMLADRAGADVGMEEAVEVARSLRARGPRAVVVTLGAAGSVAVDAEGSVHCVAAFPVKPVDTTAAGDTFCGALAAARVEGAPFGDALRFASAAAALATLGRGAQPSIPRRDAIDRVVQSGAA